VCTAPKPFRPHEIKGRVARRAIDYKKLDDVMLCESIPKSPSGSILKRGLRATESERALG